MGYIFQTHSPAFPYAIGLNGIKGLDAPQEAHQLIKTSDVGTRIAASVAKDLAPFEELLQVKVGNDECADLSPQQKRELTFEAIQDLLVNVSQDKLLIIAVEDLHWIDRTSEEFIDHLIGRLANCNIMLLLMYRLEYTHQWANKSSEIDVPDTIQELIASQ